MIGRSFKLGLYNSIFNFMRRQSNEMNSLTEGFNIMHLIVKTPLAPCLYKLCDNTCIETLLNEIAHLENIEI